jgi:hypothetical protein
VSFSYSTRCRNLIFYNQQFTEATSEAIYAFPSAPFLEFSVLGPIAETSDPSTQVAFDIRSPTVKAYAKKWRGKLENLEMITNGCDAIFSDLSGAWAMAGDL